MALLRAPLVVLRWLGVLVGVVAWLVVVPVLEIVKSIARALRRT
jgi:hypothetical protein